MKQEDDVDLCAFGCPVDASDGGRCTVRSVDLGLHDPEIISAAGDGGGNTLNGPEGIAVDPGGNVYVTGVFTSNACNEFDLATLHVPTTKPTRFPPE